MPTSDRTQRRLSKEAIAKLRDVIEILDDDITHEDDEIRRETKKAYSATERHAVKRDKHDRYGDEVYAVPKLDSYPLTQDKKPSEERVRAAWDYIHVAKNREKLGEKTAAKATARIRAFAKKHFPDMHLEETTHKSLAVDEVYVFPLESIWPLTENRQPSAERVQKAWQELHSARIEHVLPDAAMATAEQRIALFAAQHDLPLQTRRMPRTVVL
ncbi:DUF6582 domain-containing protein [Sulfobacillus harzensis]|uniref:Uncharacterized protein n=1 Tax=Sulfobacillus harzensis TaxID=2729629 RepID=A0A7Y0L022_9FIRM|nr:DUF6582 domain-containing protein [Sulfobacillus harzensis]NMP20757.1 hypothetical protein [Sulfobacillus harzensis]